MCVTDMSWTAPVWAVPTPWRREDRNFPFAYSFSPKIKNIHIPLLRQPQLWEWFPVLSSSTAPKVSFTWQLLLVCVLIWLATEQAHSLGGQPTIFVESWFLQHEMQQRSWSLRINEMKHKLAMLTSQSWSVASLRRVMLMELCINAHIKPCSVCRASVGCLLLLGCSLPPLPW